MKKNVFFVAAIFAAETDCALTHVTRMIRTILLQEVRERFS